MADSNLFKHILLTRFNLNVGYRDKYGHETLTDDWMIERFALFEKYCIPSILNQSVRNFEWLVLFDSSTPIRYGKKIEEYEAKIPFFYPIFFSSPVDYGQIRLAVRSRLLDSQKYAITTRIDNDDAAHKDFLLAVQNQFNYQWDTFIRFYFGYQWFADENVLLRMHQKAGNHFSSRIENVEKGVDSVITVDNTKIKDIPNSNVIDIKDNKDRYWVEVVHDMNVANHKRILLPEFRRSVFQDFPNIFPVNKKRRNSLLLKFLNRKLKINQSIDFMKKLLSGFIKKAQLK